MIFHTPGERRRTIALASLVALILYLAAAAIVSFASSSDLGHAVARFFVLPAIEQGGIVAIIWLGAWITFFAQREAIATTDSPFYRFLVNLTDVRGLRGLGLGLGALVLALLVVTYAYNTLTPVVGISGVLVALALVALGLPDSSSRRYSPEPPDYSVQIMPPARRVIDAG
jgi:hypothetical protein